MWQFRVQKGSEQEFERVYGAEGDWVKFFRSGEGYLGTMLYRDTEESGSYLTVDTWTSKEAYDSFQAARKNEYEELDRKCGALTESEKLLGSYIQRAQ